MKIEPYEDAAQDSAHPLQQVIDALTELDPGKSIRVSDLPTDYVGRRCDLVEKELEQATGLALKVEYGDRDRTPESFIITKLSKGVASEWREA